MVQQSTSVVIERAPTHVWDVVADLARTPAWRTTVQTITPPDRLAVGERFSGTTRLLGRTWRWVLEVTEVDVGRRLGYVVVDGVATITVTYELETHELGTRFTLTGSLGASGVLGRLLQPLAAPALRRETRTHVANLKRLVETPA